MINTITCLKKIEPVREIVDIAYEAMKKFRH